MSKANHAHIISPDRRALLGATTPDSAAEREVCGTVPPGLTPDPVRSGSKAVRPNAPERDLFTDAGRLDADDRLVALQAELTRQDAIIAAIKDEELPPGRTVISDDQEARLALADDVRDELVSEIAELPARSAPGLHAKAMTMLLMLEAETFESPLEKLTFTFAVDVLAMTEARP